MDFDKLVEYQRMIQQRLKNERKTERKIELLTIINQLTMGPKNIVQKEQLIIEASSRGFSQEEINELVEELKNDNIIYEPAPGYIKKR